jgi:hypothetical protein
MDKFSPFLPSLDNIYRICQIVYSFIDIFYLNIALVEGL